MRNCIVILGSLGALLTAGRALCGTPTTIVVDNAVLTASSVEQEGEIEVWVRRDATAPADLAGFQLRMKLSGPDDAVRFSTLTAPVEHPYVFAPVSPLPLWQTESDALRLNVGDFLDTGLAELDDGDGLGRIHFTVAGGVVPGVYHVEVLAGMDESFLAVSSSQFIPFNVQQGQITVVPEPSNIALLMLAGFLAIRLSMRRSAMARI